MIDWRERLEWHQNHPASSSMRYGIGYLIQMVGEGFEELKEILMTSAQSTDAALQAIATDLQNVATTIQTAETTLQNDLATAIVDVTAAVNGGGTVQASTLTSLQNVQATLDGLSAPLTTAVASLDAAVNPPAPAPAPTPASGS